MSNNDIVDFIKSCHPKGKSGFTIEGYDYYFNILKIIRDKMFSDIHGYYNPESSFVEFVASENWERAYLVADTRNKEAFEKIDMFRKFVKVVKSSRDYRNVKLTMILKPSSK